MARVERRSGVQSLGRGAGLWSAWQRRSPSDLQLGKTELSKERRVSVSITWA